MTHLDPDPLTILEEPPPEWDEPHRFRITAGLIAQWVAVIVLIATIAWMLAHRTAPREASDQARSAAGDRTVPGLLGASLGEGPNGPVRGLGGAPLVVTEPRDAGMARRPTVAALPSIPPLAHDSGIGTPLVGRNPVPPETDTLITGLATWYCGGGSACTHGYPALGPYAAAGPELRSMAGWRGSFVRVCSASACVRARLIDYCACSGHVIDLYRGVFARLGSPSRGVLRVTVTFVTLPHVVLPPTDVAP